MRQLADFKFIMQRIVPALVVTLCFGLLSVAYFWPSARDCSNTIVGGAGDSTAGAIWHSWQYLTLHVAPWQHASTPFTNAPAGEALWNPQFITSQAILVPMWLLSLATNPVCGWNLMIILGFVLNAAVMYGLVSWLTKNRWAGIFSGFAYAFSSYHLYKAEGHIGYVYSWVLALAIWAVLAFWRNPTIKASVSVGLSAALLAYTDGYYILIGGVTLVALIAGLAIVSIRRGSQISRYAEALALAVGVLVLTTLPITVTFLASRNQLDSSLSSARSQLSSESVTYSARLHEYLVPAYTNPIFAKYVDAYINRHLHESNISEQTLFLGYTGMLLALVGLAYAWRKRSDEEAMFVAAAGLAAVVVAGVLFSLRPIMKFHGLKIPMPSYVVIHIVSFWRVFARFFLAIHATVVALAGMGVASLHRVIKIRALAIALTIVAMILTGLEFLTFPPRVTWGYNQSPTVYSWLASQKDITEIAEYPLILPPDNHAYSYLTYQYIHHKRLFNSGLTDVPSRSVQMSIGDLSRSSNIKVLRNSGVQLVLLHTDYPYGDLPVSLPSGIEVINHFGNVVVLKISN